MLVKTGDWNVICAVRDKAKMQRQAEALGFPKGRCVLLEIARKQGHAPCMGGAHLGIFGISMRQPTTQCQLAVQCSCSCPTSFGLMLALHHFSVLCSYEIREVDLRSLDSVRKFCNSLTSPIG